MIGALSAKKSRRYDVNPDEGRTRLVKVLYIRSCSSNSKGFGYVLFRWPVLISVLIWLSVLSFLYVLVRLYINAYEWAFIWVGRRRYLRQQIRNARSYDEWKEAALRLDDYLGNTTWKEARQEFAYYDAHTVHRTIRSMRQARESGDMEALRSHVETCIKADFGGLNNNKLYSQSYFGTKRLVYDFIDEAEKSLEALRHTDYINIEEKRSLFRYLAKNYGRTALCLSGGACFAYYHFGVIKALLEASLLPSVITGTSGGGLVAALACTRTDEELRQVLIPELASKINACHDPILVWLKRWWKTGARFDACDWARQAMWFTRGSMTFKEAYERSGRILNISAIPSDPTSPAILLNYLTAPDCVIWSSLLASAAVPGILPPIVLMMKTKAGNLVPFSYGHKWRDGSLRTDIPVRALNFNFNVNFTIVSQVNPHVNIFFFSPRGSVGRPVAHRKGKGWRGGFLGSALEQSIKLDLTKWLKVLKSLELLPRPAHTDFSDVWLQKFDGTITIWPRAVLSDFYYILSDPSRERLKRMLHVGQQATWPKIEFTSHRIRLERIIEKGRAESSVRGPRPRLHEDDAGTVLSSNELEREKDSGRVMRHQQQQQQADGASTDDLTESDGSIEYH